MGSLRLFCRWFVRFVRKLVSSWCVNLAARLDFLYRSQLERLNVWNAKLVARFDRFHFARIELLQQMHVAVKFFCDCIGRVAIQKGF